MRQQRGGQVLVIVALCLVVVVGFFGLVIDFGRIYILEQALSNSVDAASLAGAQGLPTVATAKTYATNCYNAQIAGGSVTTSSPGTAPCNGINTGNADTTHYSIDGNCVAVTTPHSDAVTIAKGYSSSKVIKVRAYASFQYMIGSLFGFGSKKIYATSVSLQKGGTPLAVHSLTKANTSRALMLKSGAAVNVSGSVQVNSTHPTRALYKRGNMTASGTVKVRGGVSGGGTVTPTPETGQPQIADPFASLAAPAVPGASYAGFKLNSGTRTMNPGRYTSRVRVNGGILTMNPGIYYFNNVDFRVTGGIVNGAGVFLFFAGNSSDIVLSGGVRNLSPPTGGTYNGVLIYKRRTDTRGVVTISGGTGSFAGAIYSANRAIRITAPVFTISSTQIVGLTITLGGALTIQGADIAGGGGGGGSQSARLIE